MLQTIREHTQGWIAAIIISIIILTFALWGIHSYFEGTGNNSIVAQVNGSEITKDQLASAYERLRRQFQLQQSTQTTSNIKNDTVIKDRALKGLIEVEVLKQGSLHQGFRVSESQIDSYLQSMPEFQVNGQFSVDRFQQLLSSSMLSTGEFLDILRISLLINQPKLGIVFTDFALPMETNNTIALVNQDRNVDYLMIPFSHFSTSPQTLSADKIKAYYTEHQKDFMAPEKVSVDYVQLSLKELENQITPPSEATLANLYNENKQSYAEPQKWKLADIELPVSAQATPEEVERSQQKANQIHQTLKKGGDFLAMTKGQTQNLAAKGWLDINQVPKELRSTVSNLNQPNQISEPVKTDKGFVILKSLAIQPPKTLSFEEAKEKVKQNYVRQQAEEKFAELREQLANYAYEHPDSLDYTAKQLHTSIKTSSTFDKDQVGTDIAAHKKVRDAAFSSDVLQMKNNSDVIQISPEDLIVLRIKTHTPATLLPLPSVSKQIEQKLNAKAVETQANETAEAIKKKLEAGGDPNLLANTYSLKWQNSGDIGRYSNKVDSAILDMAFRLPNPALVQKKVVYGLTRLPNGFAVIILKSVKPGTADSQQQQIFNEQVQTAEGALEYELYKQSLIDNAKIKVS